MIETMRDFIHKVDVLGIKYMVTGTYALGAYGGIRMTRDIDVSSNLKRNIHGHFCLIQR
jgi:hypothetical protein